MGTDNNFFQNLLILSVIEMKTTPDCFHSDKNPH